MLALASTAPPAVAQEDDGAPLYLSVSAEDGSLRIQVGDLFDDDVTEALHSGLPVRIQFEVGLWRDRFFDAQEGRAEWRASVVYEPLAEEYEVEATGAAPVRVDSLSAVGDHLERAFRLPIRPRRDGRFYYLGEVRVETLSLSDLDELRRWLRGELAPAVAGEGEVESALGRGLERVVVRVLGLPARRFRVRTPSFEIERGGND